MDNVDNNSTENVTFEYRDAGTSDSFEEISVEEADSSEVTYTNWNLADPGSGEYELRGIEQDSDGNFLENATIEITIDNSGPSLEDESPTSVIDDDNPDIDATFEDDVSGLENASITFEGEESETLDIGGDFSVDLTIDSGDYDSLDDGSHSVDYEAYDQAGNQLEGSWSFTVDTIYEGPEDFSFSPSPGTIDVDEDDREIEVTVEGTGNEQTEKEMICRVNGDEEDTNSLSLSSLQDEEEVTETCDISDSFDAQFFDFEVELVDQAGNFELSESEEYGFDALSPSVDTLLSVSGVTVFNEDFELEYAASDDVAGVDIVEYFVNDDPGLDDGTQFTGSSGEFNVDTSELEEGSHTVSVRAKDALGKWGSEEEFTFDFYPDETPEIALEGDNELNVTSGSEEALELDVSNTGRILVPEGEVTGSEDFVESSEYGQLAPGNVETLDIVFSPENGLGEYTVDLQASSVDESHSVNVLVRADSSEQDEINEQVESYRNDLDDLSSRIEDLRPSLSQDRSDRVESDFDSFQSQVSNAEQSIEEGQYYEASEILENLGESRDSAESTFETVKEEHETAMRNRYILASMFFVLLLVGGGAGFVLYSEDYEIDVDSLSDLSIGVGEENSDEESDSGYSGQEEESDDDSKSAIDRIKNRVNDLRSGEESDEPEYEFK